MALECLPTSIWCSLFVNKHWKSLLKHTYSLGRMTNLPCGSYPYPLFFFKGLFRSEWELTSNCTYSHIYSLQFGALFLFFWIPTVDQFQVMNSCSVVIIDIATLAPMSLLEPFSSFQQWGLRKQTLGGWTQWERWGGEVSVPYFGATTVVGGRRSEIPYSLNHLQT